MVQKQSGMVAGIKEKICIIGKNGLLGRALCEEFHPLFDVAATGKEELDITDTAKTQKLLRQIRPQVVLLAAGCTNVDFCEENKEAAYRVNCGGFENIAAACRDIKAALIAYSTDYVFDGLGAAPYKETDEACPVSYYGYTKLEGEKAVKKTLAESVVIRTAWLFGEGGKGFVPSVIRAATEKKPIEAVADKFGSATYVKDLAAATLAVVRLMLQKRYDYQRHGILHVTNRGVTSWFDIAKYIIDCLKVDGITLKKTKLSDYPFKARRPPYSVLDNGRFEEVTQMKMRPWQDALEELLECRKS